MKKFKLTTERKFKVASGVLTAALSTGTMVELVDFATKGNMNGVWANATIFVGILAGGAYLCFSKNDEYFKDLEEQNKKEDKIKKL